VGRAQNLTHFANPEDTLKLISLMPKPDVMMTAETKEVEIEAGKTAEISVEIERQNGFRGRVPVAVMNLPPRVKLTDIGLNGVLINETETHRTFTIEALPNVEPIEQLIYVAGDIETRSDLQSAYAAPQAILLKVKPVGGKPPACPNDKPDACPTQMEMGHFVRNAPSPRRSDSTLEL
jgi:hypothetical protein